MRALRIVSLLCLCLTASLTARADDYKLETATAPVPKEIGAKIAEKLSDQVLRISGEQGVVVEIWMAKELSTKADFKPSLAIKYPFTPGQLVGAIRFPTEGAAADFRGQEIPVGIHTLRYGQQPQDGNHLGTSDVSDFLLACSAEADQDPAPIPNTMNLFKLSAKAAGTTHPAIFLLVPPPAKAYSASQLKHNDEKNWWIIQTNVNAKGAGATAPLPIQVVAVGQSAG